MATPRRQGRPVSTQFLGRERTLQCPPTARQDGLKGGGSTGTASLMTPAWLWLWPALRQPGCSVGQLLPRQEAGAWGRDWFWCEDAETGRSFHCAGPLRGECHWRGWMGCAKWMAKPSASPSKTHGCPQPGCAHRGGSGILPSDHALMVPKTGRRAGAVCRALLGKVILGTTDSPRQDVVRELAPSGSKEVAFILNESARYLSRAPKREDIRSICGPASLGQNRRMMMVATPRASARTPCWPAAVAWSP